jgi:hypothetical protein
VSTGADGEVSPLPARSPPDAWRFVNVETVQDDDIAMLEHRNQALLDIGQEHLRVHGALDHHRGDHFIVAHGGYEHDRLPFAIRGVSDEFYASRTAAIEPNHVGRDRGLIDNHQPGGIKQALFSNPEPARPGDVGAVLFLGQQTLFL